MPDEDWEVFAKRYSAEMQSAEAQHLLGTLTALSRVADFSVGCYCERADRCHRSILAQLLRSRGAAVLDGDSRPARP